MSFFQLLRTIFEEPPASEDRPHTQRSGAWRGNRLLRIKNEVLMIAPRFSETGGVSFDEQQCDWLMIPNYPLPAKWQDRRCNLLIVFPETYPLAPPIGFYLNQHFRLKNGKTDQHFVGFGAHAAPDLRAQGWYWYCVRMAEGTAGGWQPSPDYRDADNLWTFLNMVRESLTNDF